MCGWIGVGDVYEKEILLGMISIRAFLSLVGAAASRSMAAAAEICLRAFQSQLRLTKIIM